MNQTYQDIFEYESCIYNKAGYLEFKNVKFLRDFGNNDQHDFIKKGDRLSALSLTHSIKIEGYKPIPSNEWSGTEEEEEEVISEEFSDDFIKLK